MEANMIKKEWAKMSKNLKKVGLNYTCVMNARQMKLGTATIMVDFIHDPEAAIKAIMAKMDDEKEAMDCAKRNMEYMKRNRNTYDEIFLPAAISDVEKYPEIESAHRYYEYVTSSMEAFDNGAYLEFEFNRQKKRIQELRMEHIEREKKEASWEEQFNRSRARYEELIKSEPVQKFLEITGSHVHLEEVSEGTWFKVYARFTY